MKCIQIQGARGGEGVQIWHGCSPDTLQLITLSNLVPMRRHRRRSLTWFNEFDVTAAVDAPVHLFSITRLHIMGGGWGAACANASRARTDLFRGSFSICWGITGSNSCTNKTNLRFTLFLRVLRILVISSLRGLVSHATIYLHFPFFPQGKIVSFTCVSFLKFFDTNTTIEDLSVVW